MNRDTVIRKAFGLVCLMAGAFLLGSAAAKFTRADASAPAASSSVSDNWGLSFQEEGKAPVGNASPEELAKYNATFVEETEEKVIYLTFDCGFENGNTGAILDALKKHQAPATFFVVGNYLETSPDLVKRMAEEGHTVANHTYHHPDMSQISTREEFQEVGS